MDDDKPGLVSPGSRDEQGRFVKGKSGNPTGRRSMFAAYQDKCREHTDVAITTLVEALSDSDGRVRVAAAQALLDRGWGKPTQPVSGEDGGPIQLAVSAIAILKKLAGE